MNGSLSDLAGCKPAVRQTKCLRYGAREFVGSIVAGVRTLEFQDPFAVLNCCARDGHTPTAEPAPVPFLRVHSPRNFSFFLEALFSKLPAGLLP
jgi:hypothetical protein